MMSILILFAASYLLWIAVYLGYERSRRSKKERQSERVLPRQQADVSEILGKSTFSLSHSTPQVPQKIENEKAMNVADIFAAETEKYPKMVSAEELDELFAEGQELPDELEFMESVPMADKDVAAEDEILPIDEDEQDTCLAGCMPQATGIRFEDMGLAVRVAVSDKVTDKQERLQAGKTLAALKGTPMFDQLAAGDAEREERISSLIALHLATLHQPASDNPTGTIPDTFSISDIV